MKPRIFHVSETKLDYDGMFSSETPAPISTNVKVIEYSAYEKVIEALETLKKDVPWGQGDVLTMTEFIDITLKDFQVLT